MAQPTSNFKVIFIGIFIAAAILGVLVFAGIVPVNNGSVAGEITGTVNLWGTFDQTSMIPYMGDYNVRNQKVHVTYFQKNPATFDRDLVEAIASGTPPDLVLLPDNLVWRFQDKMTHIPFASLPAQTYQATFSSGSDVFTMGDGYLALPWASDPIVMYYNRDLLQSVGIAQPPTDWKTFIETVPLLVKKQSDMVINQPATAIGSFKNITHAKDLLALFFLQNGNPFISNGGAVPFPNFGTSVPLEKQAAAVNALEFYTSFSNPVKDVYTWNEGQSNDRAMFIQSNLAYYFGTASELPLIRAQNPNLNFGIALPPQNPKGGVMTSGRVYGFAIPRSAKGQVLSYTAATLLVNQISEQALITQGATTLALMPVRRDVLAQKPAADPYLGILYSASLVQKSWIDPNPTESTGVFAELVQNVNASILSPEQALTKLASQLLYMGSKI